MYQQPKDDRPMESVLMSSVGPMSSTNLSGEESTKSGAGAGSSGVIGVGGRLRVRFSESG